MNMDMDTYWSILSPIKVGLLPYIQETVGLRSRRGKR